MELSPEYLRRFSGIGRLYGFKALEKLSKSHVAVVGLGGVGSWVVEALARSGVGELTLIDHDDICASNVNRQVHAIDGTFGKFKVNIMAERVRAINPEALVFEHQELFNEESSERLLSKKFDYVVDAIDGVSAKCFLINQCLQKNLPIIVLGAVGGKRDPLQVAVDDLSRSIEDQLLMYVKKKLRGDHEFPRKKKMFDVPCVFSKERAVYFNESGVSLEKPTDLEKPLDCQTGMGSVSFLSGTFGFAASSYIVKDLLLKAGIAYPTNT